MNRLRGISGSLITRAVSSLSSPSPKPLVPKSRTTLQLAHPASSFQVSLNVRGMVPREDGCQRGDSIGVVVDNLQAEEHRATTRVKHQPVSQKHAAVLVPLFELNGEIRVILTQRNAKMKTHAGEVCLPGGKREPDDVDDTATALREAHEELGIDPRCVRVVTMMQPMLSKHLLSVRPVVGVVPNDLTFYPNASEVEDVFTAPLRLFLEPREDEYWYRDVHWEEDIKYRLHYFRYCEQKEYVIWGLTAGMLTLVAEKAFGKQPTFATHPPGSEPYTALTYASGRLVFNGKSLKNVQRSSSAAVQGAVVTDEEAEAAVGNSEDAR